jgi:YjbE family integral membrane protein
MTWLETLLGPNGTYIAQVLKIIGIDIVLAGDNAVVIALACRTLPSKQRMAGILLGAATAVVMRIIFTLAVQQMLDIILLKLFGGLLLFWIAVKLLLAEEPSEHSIKSGASLWEAVRIIAIADMVMSLDNVLAIAAAAHGDAMLIVFGLLVSIPLVVGGATIITGLLARYPFLIWAGAALLGWVAGELLATEPVLEGGVRAIAEAVGQSPKLVSRIFEVTGALLVVGIGYAIKRLATAEERI